MLLQFYNSQIKQIFRNEDMDELMRGKYFDRAILEDLESKLYFIRGYKATVCMLNSHKLML